MSISQPSRTVILAAAFGLSLALAGCESSDVIDKVQDSVADFNPFGVTKKKLPGVRHEVFPSGVPGVQQGVPPDLMVGAKPPPDETADITPQPAPAAKPVRERKPKVANRHTTPTAKRETRRPAQHPVAAREPAPQATDPAWATAPAAVPSAQVRRQPAAADPAWGSVPTTGGAPKSAVAPQAARPAPNSGSTWTNPASQPVPTIWPDPK